MGYLDQYGAGVERRLRLWKRTAIAVAAALCAGGVLYLQFGNFRQERQAKRFFELLAVRDFDAAYRTWAPTAADQRGYPMEAFLEDWGPDSGRNGYPIEERPACGSGVILTVASGKGRERLWVQRDTLVIGFAPPADLLPRSCSL